MGLKNKTTFCVEGLNQEKVLNKISKEIFLFDINRISKEKTIFSCAYSDRKKVEKCLKSNNFNIVFIKNEGFFYIFSKFLTNYGLIFAILIFFIFYFTQSNLILQYDISGESVLQEKEVVSFLKENLSRNKKEIDLQEAENALRTNFDEISFVSCIIKGQTLIVNIKEKLLPNEIYGEFEPILSTKNGKIKSIDLVSGTLNVKTGDFVKEGDVLVLPYVIDASGEIKEVEPKATIVAEVYYEGVAEHYQSKVERIRTGRVVEKNSITLFGLEIYSYEPDIQFEKYESEEEEVELVDNLLLPLKMKKTICYEVEEVLVETDFENVKEKFIEDAKQNALSKSEGCDKIIEEFYTLRHLCGMTTVNYCIVAEQQIGGNNDNWRKFISL